MNISKLITKCHKIVHLFVIFITIQALPYAEVSYAEDRHELAPGVTIGGSLRTRNEYKYDFKFNKSTPGNTDNYFLSQVRVNLKWDICSDTTFYVEGQDSAIQGDNFVDQDAKPNIYSDNFDLHQAYIEQAFKEHFVSYKIGRQKLKYGDERIVGPLEWVNTARVFDAAKITLGDLNKRSADIFASRVVAVDPNNFNDWSLSSNRYSNSDFHGVYYSDKSLLENVTADLYYLLRHENDANDQVNTFGTRIAKKAAAWDSDGELVYQTGDFSGLDHRAFAAHIGSGLIIEQANKLRLGIAYNYASGDDNPNDSKHETFDNLFPTNHAYYGYMDFFSLQNVHNLENTISFTPIENLDLRLAWQNFWLAEEDTDAWYNAGLGTIRTPTGTDNNSYVGSEIDVTASYPIWKNKLAFLIGYSHFFVSDYVKDAGDNNDADFVYLQAKLTL
jgi:Alginate export